MANIIPPAPVDAPFGSYGWQDWYVKVRKAINDGATVLWSSISGLPTTVGGYGITDVTSGTYTPVISGATNFTGSVLPQGDWSYMRVKNQVRVWGTVEAASSSISNAFFRFTLPITEGALAGQGMGYKLHPDGLTPIRVRVYPASGVDPEYGIADQWKADGNVSSMWFLDFQYNLA